MKGGFFVGLVIVALICVGLWFFVFHKPSAVIDEATATCISEKSVVFVQDGCVHCESQKALFGDTWRLVHTVDCKLTPEPCVGESITATPTWIIGGQKIEGMLSVSELKSLTGC